jgi:hypothetical protein
VADLRVGVHDGLTRVVIETDVRTGYRIDDGTAGEILVHVDARGAARQLAAPGRLLESVDLEEAEGGSLARLKLQTAGVRIRDRVFEQPPRIVLDLMEPDADDVAWAPSPSPKPTLPAPDPVPETMDPSVAAGPPDPELVLGRPRANGVPPARPAPAIYRWVDESGITHYTADLKRIPKELRNRLGTPEPAEASAGERSKTLE